MSKYIKLEDAIETYRKSLEQNKSFASMLQKLPPVEIVRCKDCKFRDVSSSTKKWWCCSDLSEEFDKAVDKEQDACDEYEEER